jgi:hypothetical protein
VALEELEHNLEAAAHVRVEELAHVRLVLDVRAELGVLEHARLNRRAWQARERAQRPVHRDIARRHQLVRASAAAAFTCE